MTPISPEDMLKLTQVHGIANVFSVVLIIAFLATFFFTLRWIFKTTALREEQMAIIINVGMKAITDALVSNTLMTNQITQNVKDGFDALARANDHQRDEHSKIVSLLNDIECKAK